MLPTSGRPRKACSTCKSQKIRCSGERPVCKRCARLGHARVYSNKRPSARNLSKPTQASESSVATDTYPSPISTAAREGIHSIDCEPSREERNATASCPAYLGRLVTANKTVHLRNTSTASASLLDNPEQCDRYLGIPKTLISTLVEVYFDNVYNATLLIHQRSFLQSLTAGTVRPHLVLSVCAWAANFYRDAAGQAPWRDYGFMVEWAKQAGKLENIVTFCNLALFWHSQGSWRMAYLYKGNACQLLHIIGLGAQTRISESSLESEIRRRRFWACDLMHCQNSEPLSLFQPIADMADLTLPSSVVSFIKSSESSRSVKISQIHTLDEKISQWWRNLTPDLKLTSSSIVAVPHDMLPNILIINVAYHLSLCALHGSIVPLFCWSVSDENWLSAGQFSAQVAFEHANLVSALINSVLTTFDCLSSIPTFIAYAAYCGCAIQIPFMWCSDTGLRERAHVNVKANVKLIHLLASYWKFAALLRVHARCLYNVHKKLPIILEGEPKLVDPAKLTSYRINATYARATILEYTGILVSPRDGYTRPGEENNDLGIEDDGSDLRVQSRHEQGGKGSQNVMKDERLKGNANETLSDSIFLQVRPNDAMETTYSSNSPTSPHSPGRDAQQQKEQYAPQLLQQQQRVETMSPSIPALPEIPAMYAQSLNMFYPFFDPQLIGLFPDGEMPDFSPFETNSSGLNYFEIEGRDNNSSSILSSG
ncbi:hypothetical protein EJ08DRAFT_671462 [Tothia fuscella]|uniref:Zn(2)-C6 fungal-type domain-containing protein n=1 Tax=Tothia fuscella TaxID=1048955 RepID=A0A9P4NN21_9PEZI|nr:hypothetical protein EJ08DRAFT_671462 [Tothia fuscella]